MTIINNNLLLLWEKLDVKMSIFYYSGSAFIKTKSGFSAHTYFTFRTNLRSFPAIGSIC